MASATFFLFLPDPLSFIALVFPPSPPLTLRLRLLVLWYAPGPRLCAERRLSPWRGSDGVCSTLTLQPVCKTLASCDLVTPMRNLHRPAELNENSHSDEIVKAAVCAGLYPNVLRVVLPMAQYAKVRPVPAPAAPWLRRRCNGVRGC